MPVGARTVAASFARAAGVREVTGAGDASVTIRYVDGTRLDLHCVRPDEFAIAWWRATGSETHLDDVRAHAATRGLAIVGDSLRDATGSPIEIADEAEFFEAVGLRYIPPELREGAREVDAAHRGDIPTLVEYADIRGVLHCHSRYSDGTASIAELAEAAKRRG